MELKCGTCSFGRELYRLQMFEEIEHHQVFYFEMIDLGQLKRRQQTQL